MLAAKPEPQISLHKGFYHPDTKLVKSASSSFGIFQSLTIQTNLKMKFSLYKKEQKNKDYFRYQVK